MNLHALSGIAVGIALYAMIFAPATIDDWVRDKTCIRQAYKNWQKRRKKVERWLAGHEYTDARCFDNEKCQILITREFGALMLYTGLKGSATEEQSIRLSWLSTKMREDFIACLPNE